MKANSPEQRRFAQAMKDVDVLYKTKRGEEVDKKYRDIYKNTNLAEIGKFCMAAIFQEPCKSRNKPSDSYNVPNYYNPIFKDNPESKSDFYEIFRNLGGIQFLLPTKINTDAYDTTLSKLFKAIIKAGTQTYVYTRDNHDKTLTARNFLQNDKNYYRILTEHWDTLHEDIQEIFSNA